MNLFHRVVLSYEKAVANVMWELSCSELVVHCSEQRFVQGTVSFGRLNLQTRLRDLVFFYWNLTSRVNF